MRAFVPKLESIRRVESTRSLLPRPSWAGQSRDPNPLFTLQRTIGNRAVQEILRGDAGGGPAAPGLSGVAVSVPGDPCVLQRKIEFTQPTPILADPIPLVLGGRSILGSTLPSLNGTVLPGHAIKKDYKEAVFNALQPKTFTFSDTRDGKTCKVTPDNFTIAVSAEVRAIKEPDHGKWAGSYPPATLGSPPTVCAGKREDIAVEMKGKPDSAALCTKVRSHEQEHVTDLKNLVNRELKPYHDFLVGLTGTGKSEKECVDNLFTQVGKKDAEAAGTFVDKWLDAVQAYDKPGGTHHSKFETTVDAGCTTMRIEEKL